MPEFRYEAIDPYGALVKGSVTAASEPQARQRLGGEGLSVVTVRQRARAGLLAFGGRGKVKPRILIEFYYRLGQSLQMGIPVITALREVGEMLPSPAMRAVIEELLVSIGGGATLGEALTLFPEVFDKLSLALIGMGEETGELPAALESLTAFIEWKEEIRATVRKAVIYPAFIGVSMLATVGVWVGYVLPQMAGLLKEMGVPLPEVTLALISLSAFVTTWWAELLAGMVAAAIALGLVLRTPRGKLGMDRLMLRLPVVGGISFGLAIARLSHNFATGYRAGIPVTGILSMLAGGTLGNLHLEARIKACLDGVQHGLSLSQAFEREPDFPKMVTGAIRNGEMVGSLDASFRRLGAYYDTEVRRSVQTLLGALEPLTLFVLGGTFGVIVLSIMLPLYDVLGGADKAY